MRLISFKLVVALYTRIHEAFQSSVNNVRAVEVVFLTVGQRAFSGRGRPKEPFRSNASDDEAAASRKPL